MVLERRCNHGNENGTDHVYHICSQCKTAGDSNWKKCPKCKTKMKMQDNQPNIKIPLAETPF